MDLQPESLSHFLTDTLKSSNFCRQKQRRKEEFSLAHLKHFPNFWRGKFRTCSLPERRERSPRFPQTHSTQYLLAARDHDISVRAQRSRPCPALSAGSHGIPRGRGTPEPPFLSRAGGTPHPATDPQGSSSATRSSPARCLPGSGGVAAHLGAAGGHRRCPAARCRPPLPFVARLRREMPSSPLPPNRGHRRPNRSN